MRYAIYYMPPTGSLLWSFGSHILGYDAARSIDVPFPETATGLPWMQWTSDPRRYGFHATLKAPFYLTEGAGEADLIDIARQFASRRTTFEEPALQLTATSGFLGLTLKRESVRLSQLADDAVREFDVLRAPLTQADRARNRMRPLSPRQVQHLEHWGYPYVLEDFTFHMTLSNSLPAMELSQMRPLVAKLYLEIAEPLLVDAIAVFKQPTPASRFHLLERIRLGAA